MHYITLHQNDPTQKFEILRCFFFQFLRKKKKRILENLDFCCLFLFSSNFNIFILYLRPTFISSVSRRVGAFQVDFKHTNHLTSSITIKIRLSHTNKMKNSASLTKLFSLKKICNKSC